MELEVKETIKTYITNKHYVEQIQFQEIVNLKQSNKLDEWLDFYMNNQIAIQVNNEYRLAKIIGVDSKYLTVTWSNNDGMMYMDCEQFNEHPVYKIIA